MNFPKLSHTPSANAEAVLPTLTAEDRLKGRIEHGFGILRAIRESNKKALKFTYGELKEALLLKALHEQQSTNPDLLPMHAFASACRKIGLNYLVATRIMRDIACMLGITSPRLAAASLSRAFHTILPGPATADWGLNVRVWSRAAKNLSLVTAHGHDPVKIMELRNKIAKHERAILAALENGTSSADGLNDDFAPEIGQSDYDGTAVYFKDVRTYRRLTHAEEKELGAHARNGDACAIERLVTSNLRLVAHIAGKGHRNSSFFQDRISEGNIGLFKAAPLYDPAMGCTFGTYVTWRIKAYIAREIKEQMTLSLPVQLRMLLQKIRHEELLFEEQYGRSPTDREIAEIMEQPEEQVAELRSVRELQSLEQCRKVDQQDFNSSNPGEAAAYKDDLRHLRKSMGSLSDMERTILEKRCGMTDVGIEQTLEEIGDGFGLTRERIRQIESVAITKLRAALDKACRPPSPEASALAAKLPRLVPEKKKRGPKPGTKRLPGQKRLGRPPRSVWKRHRGRDVRVVNIFTPERKAYLVQRYGNGESAAKICREHKIELSQLYQWIRDARPVFKAPSSTVLAGMRRKAKTG